MDPAPLTFNVVNQTMTYGGALPALTGSFDASGFVNGDNSSDFTTPPTIMTTATSGGGRVPMASGQRRWGSQLHHHLRSRHTDCESGAITTVRQLEHGLRRHGPHADPNFQRIRQRRQRRQPDKPAESADEPTSSSDVGDYAVNVSGGGDPNYTIGSDVPGVLTVHPHAADNQRYDGKHGLRRRCARIYSNFQRFRQWRQRR